MAKKLSETGQAVNANNFTRLKERVDVLGVTYSPPTTDISAANITAKDTRIHQVMSEFLGRSGPWTIAVTDRSTALKVVNPLVTKIVNEVMVCDVTDDYKSSVRSLGNEIRGIRATPKIKMEPGDPSMPSNKTIVQISASQQGFDNKLFNFEKMFELLKAQPKYTPTEPELMLAAIQAVIDNLKVKNQAVTVATPLLENARIARNKEMYDAVDGGNILASKVKRYFKAKFGGNSAEYHAVAKLKFRDLSK
jgi:hypothetical protein